MCECKYIFTQRVFVIVQTIYRTTKQMNGELEKKTQQRMSKPSRSKPVSDSPIHASNLIFQKRIQRRKPLRIVLIERPLQIHTIVVSLWFFFF